MCNKHAAYSGEVALTVAFALECNKGLATSCLDLHTVYKRVRDGKNGRRKGKIEGEFALRVATAFVRNKHAAITTLSSTLYFALYMQCTNGY